MHWQLWWEYRRQGFHWTCEEEAVKVDSCQMLAGHAEPAAHNLHDAHTCLPAHRGFSQLSCRTNKGMVWVVIWDKALLPPGLRIALGFGSQGVYLCYPRFLLMYRFQQWKIRDAWRQFLTSASLDLLTCVLIQSQENFGPCRGPSQKSIWPCIYNSLNRSLNNKWAKPTISFSIVL